MNNKKQLSYLDFIRLLAAFGVVFIHCFREDYGFTNIYLAEYMGRWPVGFFFLLSGFFLKDDFKAFARYIIRIFILYFVWTLIYALILDINIWNPWDLFLNFRGGIIMPFWYFPSLLMCLVWVWLLNKIFRSEKIVCLICGCLFIIALLGSEFINIPSVNSFMNSFFFPIFERIQGVHTTRDGIFNGSFFISIGLLLQSVNKRRPLAELNRNKVLSLLLISIILYISEITLVINLGLGYLDVLISTPIICTCILLTGTQFKMDRNKSLFYRGLSSGIFVIHYLFLTMLQRYFLNQWIWLIGTSLLSLAFSIILIKLSNKIKLLNYLY